MIATGMGSTPTPLDQEAVTAHLLARLAECPATQLWMETLATLQLARLAYSAVRLGIFDHLGDTGQPLGIVAEATGCDAAMLRRLLRALTFAGLAREHSPDCFTNSPLGSALRGNVLPPLGQALVDFFEPPLVPLNGLVNTVRAGRPAFELQHGIPFYSYLETTALDRGARFDQSMNHGSRLRVAPLLDHVNFTDVSVVVDVGGGEGALLAQLLIRFPHLRAINLERSTTAQRSILRLERWGLGDRCQVVAGDFFEKIPKGGDAYILSFVLHNWNDKQGAQILAACRAAMPHSGRLLIIEQVRDRVESATIEEYLDLPGLELLGGCERSEADFRALLCKAGFIVSGIFRSTLNPFALIEASVSSG